MGALNSGFIATVAGAAGTLTELFVVVDGGSGVTDAAQVIGLQPDGFAIFGTGVVFYCVERTTLTVAETALWLSVVDPATVVNFATGTVSATAFRFHRVPVPDIASGNRQSPAVAF